MSFSEVLEVIKSLASSQGFYSRLYNNMKEMEENDPENFKSVKETLEQQKFKDSVDVVLFFEA